MRKISIGCDHAGFQMKEHLKTYLVQKGLAVTDHGCYSEESVDYPDFAHKVATDVETHPETTGILLCGSGNGITMAANKHQGIRAALCWTEEIASLARQHNNANILSLPARFISNEQAEKITDTFLDALFEGGRHERRVNKIQCA